MGRPRIRGFIATLTTLCVTVASLLFVTGTASAVRGCSSGNTKTFPTPASDIEVTVKLCVHAVGGKVWADAVVSWDRLIMPPVGTFDKFEFNVRLEFKDSVKDREGCYPVNHMNDQRAGHVECHATSELTYSGGAYWTADADVRYDINNDGQGDFIWPLTGSSAV